MPRTSKPPCEDGWVIQYNTIKARLYPTHAQAELFEKTFGCCRYIWNQMLADQQRFCLETSAHFIPTPAKYKNSAPFLREVDNQALIQEHNKLSQAFRVFFKNPDAFGYPNFKRKKDDRNSFTACNHVFESGPTIYTTKNGIRMTKAGIVKAKFPRRAQGWWKLKRITVEKTRSGNYYCYILYECRVRQAEPVLPTPETTVGLKYSMPHFYVADDGSMADPPHWLKQSQEKLSSGYKINRAGDAAAGLAISEKMHAQITGLNAAAKNVKDGTSLVKTAEGAMQEIHDMLNRMDYLATQSANGTYDNEVDRLNLQKMNGTVASGFDVTVDGTKVTLTAKTEGTEGAAKLTSVKSTDATVTLGADTVTAGVNGTTTFSGGWDGLFSSDGTTTSVNGVVPKEGDTLTFKFKGNAGEVLTASIKITADMFGTDGKVSTLTANIADKLANASFDDVAGTGIDESTLKVSDLFTINANKKGKDGAANDGGFQVISKNAGLSEIRPKFQSGPLSLSQPRRPVRHSAQLRGKSPS